MKCNEWQKWFWTFCKSNRNLKRLEASGVVLLNLHCAYRTEIKIKISWINCLLFNSKCSNWPNKRSISFWPMRFRHPNIYCTFTTTRNPRQQDSGFICFKIKSEYRHKLFESHYVQQSTMCGQLLLFVWWLFQITGHNILFYYYYHLLSTYDEIIPNIINFQPMSWKRFPSSWKKMKNHDHFIHFNTRIIVIIIIMISK